MLFLDISLPNSLHKSNHNTFCISLSMTACITTIIHNDDYLTPCLEEAEEDKVVPDQQQKHTAQKHTKEEPSAAHLPTI